MMQEQQQRFYRAFRAMEEEGEQEEAPLEPALEDRLVSAVVRQVSAQRTRRRWVAGVTMMAAAACLVAVVGLRQPSGLVPAYQVYVSGDDKLLGSPPRTPQGDPQLAADSMLSVELRPQDALRGEAQARAYLRQDGRLSPWPLSLTHTPKGVFRLQVPVQLLPEHHPGKLELIFAIGRHGSEPTPSEITQALLREPPQTASGWRVLRQPVEISPR